MRLNRKLNIARVVAAMEKADPTCRVNTGYDKRGKVMFTKRKKTDKEIELEGLIALTKERIQEKAKSAMDQIKQLDKAKYALDESAPKIVVNDESTLTK